MESIWWHGQPGCRKGRDVNRDVCTWCAGCVLVPVACGKGALAHDCLQVSFGTVVKQLISLSSQCCLTLCVRTLSHGTGCPAPVLTGFCCMHAHMQMPVGGRLTPNAVLLVEVLKPAGTLGWYQPVLVLSPQLNGSLSLPTLDDIDPVRFNTNVRGIGFTQRVCLRVAVTPVRRLVLRSCCRCCCCVLFSHTFFDRRVS